MHSQKIALTGLAFFTLLALPLRPYTLAHRPPIQDPIPAEASGWASPAEFARVIADLRAAAPEGAEPRKALELALDMLDRVVANSLNGHGEDRLSIVNQRLAGYVTRQPAAGEGYHLSRIGLEPDVYALAANFGSSGPSAVRVYARAAPHGPFQVAGRIDRFSQKEYFDDYLELLAVDPRAAVFVTVTGRTDEFESGSFAAWRFGAKGLVAVWSSDLLPHSSYEPVPGGIVITYCPDPDEQNPALCRRMLRERHQWDGSTWKQINQEARHDLLAAMYAINSSAML